MLSYAFFFFLGLFWELHTCVLAIPGKRMYLQLIGLAIGLKSVMFVHGLNVNKSVEIKR